MKPSVAKKLNDRIKALEMELSIARSQTTIEDLEKKVAVSGRGSSARACVRVCVHARACV